MKDLRPIVGITMGDPVGIGPEIIISALSDISIYDACKPLVIGDAGRLETAATYKSADLTLKVLDHPESGGYAPGAIDVLSVSDLRNDALSWGTPTPSTGRAMISYVEEGIRLALGGRLSAIVTCPINKAAMKMAGSRFSGHTELLADNTGTKRYAMMLAGNRLRVVLVTIHTALKNVPEMLSVDRIRATIDITNEALSERFGFENFNIAVAGLNPHAGEEGMFGDEEERLIAPAVKQARKKGIPVTGPFPPDTVFYHALEGRFDAVVCMYHDQGLIPFKMIHFTDGVNTTLGLPIIRTSVDHGTAYDIAGTGAADPGSLIAAIKMAAEHATHSMAMKQNRR